MTILPHNSRHILYSIFTASTHYAAATLRNNIVHKQQLISNSWLHNSSRSSSCTAEHKSFNPPEARVSPTQTESSVNTVEYVQFLKYIKTSLQPTEITEDPIWRCISTDNKCSDDVSLTELLQFVLRLAEMKYFTVLTSSTPSLQKTLHTFEDRITADDVHTIFKLINEFNKSNVCCDELYQIISNHSNKLDTLMLSKLTTLCAAQGLRCAPYLDKLMYEVSNKWSTLSLNESFEVLKSICHVSLRYANFIQSIHNHINKMVDAAPPTQLHALLIICYKFKNFKQFKYIRTRAAKKFITAASTLSPLYILHCLTTLRSLHLPTEAEKQLLQIILQINQNSFKNHSITTSKLLSIFATLLHLPNVNYKHLKCISNELVNRSFHINEVADQHLIIDVIQSITSNLNEVDGRIITVLLPACLHRFHSIPHPLKQQLRILRSLNNIQHLYTPLIETTQTMMITASTHLYTTPFSMPLSILADSNRLTKELCHLYLTNYKHCVKQLGHIKMYIKSFVENCYSIIVADAHKNETFAMYLKVLTSSEFWSSVVDVSCDSALKLCYVLVACKVELPLMYEAMNVCDEEVAAYLQRCTSNEEDAVKSICIQEMRVCFNELKVDVHSTDMYSPFWLDLIFTNFINCGVLLISDVSYYKCIGDIHKLQESGLLQLQRRLLQNIGWTIIYLNTSEWLKLPDLCSKQQMLQPYVEAIKHKSNMDP